MITINYLYYITLHVNVHYNKNLSKYMKTHRLQLDYLGRPEGNIMN